MKYKNMTWGQMEAVVDKLGGMDGVHKLLSGELIVKEEECQWKIWKTIKIGTGLKSADDFRRAIKDAGMEIGNYANDIIGKSSFTVATKETKIDLVLVTVAELGFKDGAIRENVYKRAKKLGLELCSVEVGLQLRLQYKDQPNGEWILVGMKTIFDSGGYLGVFNVKHDGGGLWLNGRYCYPGDFWDGDGRLVFVSRNI